MRSLILLPLVVIAACSPGTQPKADKPAAAAQPTPPADLPATSPAALQARDTVERYFAHIRAKRYGDAYRIWDKDGVATGGSEQDFAETFKIYSVYEPETGEPTAIKTRDGVQYVLVTATTRVKNAKDGRVANRSGTVMLRRPAAAGAGESGGEWKIWGTDIRARR